MSERKKYTVEAQEQDDEWAPVYRCHDFAEAERFGREWREFWGVAVRIQWVRSKEDVAAGVGAHLLDDV